jgi:hypothetical protein
MNSFMCGERKIDHSQRKINMYLLIAQETMSNSKVRLIEARGGGCHTSQIVSTKHVNFV